MKVRKIKSQAYRHTGAMSANECFQNRHDLKSVLTFFARKEKKDIGYPYIRKYKDWSSEMVNDWLVYYPSGESLPRLMALNNEQKIRHQDNIMLTMVIYPF